MSVLILSAAYALVLSVVDAMEATMEAVYKHNHNKRRRYW